MPDTIIQSFRPTLMTKVVLESAHAAHTPLQLYTNTFVPKPTGIEWLFGMEMYRYQSQSTNFTAVERFQFRRLESDTNFISRLLDGDILFFHGHVD